MDGTTATQSIPETVLNDVTALQSFLREYANLPEKPPSTVYANLEGIRLGRNGSISIISLFRAFSGQGVSRRPDLLR